MDTLGEDLLLLSIGPDSGRIKTAQKIGYGLMGSELVRLAASGRIVIEAGVVVVRSAAPTGDPELDAALASIAQARRPPRPGRWVARPRRGICDAYLQRLAAAGYIRKDGTLLTRWRIVDAQRVADAQARMDAIAASGAPPDLAQVAFGGLAHAIGLDGVLYPGWGNRGIRRHFQQVASGQRAATDLPLSEGPADALTVAEMASADAATQAAVHASTQAAMHAATQAAVHAATQAAVDASVAAAHSAAASGAHGGHGGH